MKPFSKLDYLKIAVIPILLAVLYSVLPKTSADPDRVSDIPKLATSEVLSGGRRMSGRNENASLNKMALRTRWPSFQLSDLGDVNPFDRRMIFADLPAQATSVDGTFTDKQSLVAVTALPLAKRLAAIRVQAVFQSPRGVAALVGERVIHVGDRLEDGTEVIGITPEQLEVASTDSY